jgi:hypothetical protein
VNVKWTVGFCDEFGVEFDALPQAVRVEFMSIVKSGMSEQRFYQRLIKKADARFETHCINVGKGR